MATRVQNMPNGPKMIIFACPPSVVWSRKPKHGETCRPVVFRAKILPGDLDRRPEAPGPDLQLENSPIEPDPPAHCHTVKNDREGTAKNNSSAGKIFYIQKRTERAYFLFWPGRTNMEEGGSGRGTHVYACCRLRVRTPLCMWGWGPGVHTRPI